LSRMAESTTRLFSLGMDASRTVDSVMILSVLLQIEFSSREVSNYETTEQPKAEQFTSRHCRVLVLRPESCRSRSRIEDL
jgi:hypothetical protein